MIDVRITITATNFFGCPSGHPSKNIMKIFTPGMRVRVKLGIHVQCSNAYGRNAEECMIHEGEQGRIVESGGKLFARFSLNRKLEVSREMLPDEDESLEVL